MKKMKQSKSKFWLFYLIALMPFSVAVGMLMKYNQTGNALHPTVIVPIFVIYFMSASVGCSTLFIINKAKKYNQSQINKLIIPALFIFNAATFFLANLSVAIGDFGWFIYTGKDLSGFWPSLKLDLGYANSRLYLWLMLFTIIFFYILWQKSAKKEQKLIEENLKHRYNTLKAQVNPHFLFNSLNILSELVYIDAKKSDNYIQTLSSIYRYVLENEEVDLIDLEKEIEFVKQYFSLQQVRDEGKISLEINIDEPKGIKIIPVSLQLLLENALKHNTMSLEKPLKIRISLKDDYIIVSNPIQKKNILENSIQIGLSNLKDRAKIIMGTEPEIITENNNFTVKLPIQKLK
jgi:two-component system, LytTR family, sensor kinase